MIIFFGVFLFSRCALSFETEDNSTYLPDDFKCALPDITSVDSELNLTRFRTEFSKISEVKFPGLIGPLNEKLICKIKCIDGNWVGPLCSLTPNGRFQPILRECAYNTSHALLSVTYKNSSINVSSIAKLPLLGTSACLSCFWGWDLIPSKATAFPHGSTVTARCRHFGLYKLKGEASVRCENGEWIPKFPSCVPTNLVTNFSGDAPPAIVHSVASGSAAVQRSGELVAFPESSLRLDCLSPRAFGDPEWTWTQPLGNHQIAWSDEESEANTRYRLSLMKMTSRHSDNYTCTSPKGHTNTITIKVVNVSCGQRDATTPHLQVFSEGSRLGQSDHFSCRAGYHLEGDAVVTCMADGKWSSSTPKCVETFCPVVRLLDPHLSLVEYNSSIGGRAMFQCAWGYKLVGMPGLECEQDGRWSGAMPQCIAVHCPKPLVPENGRLVSGASLADDKYPVGDLVFYSCDEGYDVLGESSIVCTENGFWSHPPPFCLLPTEIRKADTIYLENTTLVYFNED